MYTFPEFTNQSVMEQIKEMWDLSGRVPLPKFNPHCPVCRHDEILLKHWHFFIVIKRETANPRRCDVHMKCMKCSLVWRHGLVVPKSIHPGKRVIIYWRQIKEEMKSGKDV